MEKIYFTKNVVPYVVFPSSGSEGVVDKLNNLNGKIITVVNDNKRPNNVVINMPKREIEGLVKMAKVHEFEPTLIMAIIAHETKFQPNQTSNVSASGYMQVMPKYFKENLDYNSDVKNIAYSYAGDEINNIYNPYGNMAAGINQLAAWREKFGEEDMLKSMRQGNKNIKKYYPNGWSKNAIHNNKEFLEIKKQLDILLKEGE